MFSNQQTRHLSYDYLTNSKDNNDLSFNSSRPSFPDHRTSISTIHFNDRSNFNQQQSVTGPVYGSLPANSYMPPGTSRFSVTNNHNRRLSNGSTSGGAIEKTNMMSSENPFVDPARPYEQYSSPRSITSITSPRKSEGGINKSLNLSNENPFHAIYGGYRYPSQVDPSKRITSQNTTVRSADSKSLHMSDENPFIATYERYQPSTQANLQRRFTDIPTVTGPSSSSNGLTHSSSFNTYRPSLIRQYSAGDIGNGSNLVSTSIADWARNNPAPLSYRPIHVQRPPPEYYTPIESSYVPPSSSPRQQQLSPRAVPILSSPVQSKKANLSAPLGKTSLNMSPDNPFTRTHGRYHYPSQDEIKSQKREGERTVRFADEVSTNENQTVVPPTNNVREPSEPEKKEVISNKDKMKSTRFDITF